MKIKNLLTIPAFLIILFESKNDFAKANGFFTKEKKVYKEYKGTASDTLTIINSFGNIFINTWNKNEITIDIIATGTAKTKSRAGEILGNITFNEKKGKHKIYWETSVRSSYNNNNGVNGIEKSRHQYEAGVVYKINAPKNISVGIKNYFGNVSIGDFSGKLNVEIMQGTLQAKKLWGANKDITINGSYGRQNTITSIEAGNLICNRDCALIIDSPINKEKVKLEGWGQLVINKVSAH